jgi:hypothetical protein
MAVTQYGFHETLINRFETALNGSITAAATTITVDSVTGLPAEGYFYLLIESELIRCSGYSGLVIQVAGRGAEGTTAATHADNTLVEAVLTNEGLQRYLLSNNDGCAAYSQDNPTSVTGYEGYTVPLNRATDAARANLTASSFTWHNQGSATLVDSAGGFKMTVPDEANHALRGVTITAPTAPYMFTTRIRGFVAPGEPIGGNSTHGGLWIRDSGGKLLTLSVRQGQATAMWEWTNWTTFSSTVGTTLDYHDVNHLWLRLFDDNTNIQGFFSVDGSNWSHYGTAWWDQSRTAHLTSGGNGIGFYLNSGTNSGSSGAGPATATASFECFDVEER